MSYQVDPITLLFNDLNPIETSELFDIVEAGVRRGEWFTTHRSFQSFAKANNVSEEECGIIYLSFLLKATFSLALVYKGSLELPFDYGS